MQAVIVGRTVGGEREVGVFQSLALPFEHQLAQGAVLDVERADRVDPALVRAKDEVVSGRARLGDLGLLELELAAGGFRSQFPDDEREPRREAGGDVDGEGQPVKAAASRLGRCQLE